MILALIGLWCIPERRMAYNTVLIRDIGHRKSSSINGSIQKENHRSMIAKIKIGIKKRVWIVFR